MSSTLRVTDAAGRGLLHDWHNQQIPVRQVKHTVRQQQRNTLRLLLVSQSRTTRGEPGSTEPSCAMNALLKPFSALHVEFAVGPTVASGGSGGGGRGTLNSYRGNNTPARCRLCGGSFQQAHGRWLRLFLLKYQPLHDLLSAQTKENSREWWSVFSSPFSPGNA